MAMARCHGMVVVLFVYRVAKAKALEYQHQQKPAQQGKPEQDSGKVATGFLGHMETLRHDNQQGTSKENATSKGCKESHAVVVQ